MHNKIVIRIIKYQLRTYMEWKQHNMKRLLHLRAIGDLIHKFLKLSIKSICIILGTLTLSYLILPVFEEIINISVVRWTEEYFQNDTFFGVLFICTVSLITIALCKWMIKYKHQWIQWKYIDVLIGIVLIWGYYRCLKEIWYFEEVFNTQIAYVDILSLQVLVLITCALIININVYRKYIHKSLNLKHNPSIIKLDNPISQEFEDKLNRTYFTGCIVNIVNGLDLKDSSYSIAITAPWGHGKTSFINLFKKKLKESTNIRIISFTPWLLTPKTSITRAFYLLLARELGGINRQLSNLIKQYLKILDTNFEKRLSYFYENNSLEEIYSNISKYLKANKNKIVIIIDDIDRLSSEEIIEVFKIIRGSANFPNIIFISCFDKEYVNTALIKHFEALKYTYIEKFFQLEFPLPPYNTDILRSMAIEFAEKMFVNSQNDLEVFKDYVKGSELRLFQNRDIINFFENPRQLFRWLNNLTLSYSAIKRECHIADLGDIELLKMFYPTIYSLVSNSFEKYFTFSNNGVKLWNETMESENDKWLSMPHKDLHKSTEYLNLSNDEKENVDAIFHRLVGVFVGNEALRFATPGYSKRYLFGKLQENEVTQTEFFELLNMAPNDMLKKIEKNYTNRINGLTLLCQTIDVKKAADEENIIRMVLFLSSLSYDFAFNINRLMSRLERIEESNIKREEKLMGLIKAAPLSAWISTIFCRSLSHNFILSRNRNGQIEYLSEKFMDEVQISNMQKAYKEKLDLNEMREWYRFSCHNFLTENQLKSNSIKANDLDKPTDDIMRNYIIENIEQNLEYLYCLDTRNEILRNESTPESIKYAITWPFNTLWDSWDNVETYASTHKHPLPKSKKFEELKDLFEKYKQQGGAVDFELKYLKQPLG